VLQPKETGRIDARCADGCVHRADAEGEGDEGARQPKGGIGARTCVAHRQEHSTQSARPEQSIRRGHGPHPKGQRAHRSASAASRHRPPA